MSTQQTIALSVLTGLLEQQSRELSDLKRDEAKFRLLQDRIRKRRQPLALIENQIRDAKIKSNNIPLPVRGIPNARSMDVLRVWSALYETLIAHREPEGLLHYQVCDVIRRAVPDIADATVRSHLLRLKRQGYLAKNLGRWRLLIDTKPTASVQT
jgi:hypothetical protein